MHGQPNVKFNTILYYQAISRSLFPQVNYCDGEKLLSILYKYTVYWAYLLILSFHLYLGLPGVPLVENLATKCYVHFLMSFNVP
jgi:hypothetical protein